MLIRVSVVIRPYVVIKRNILKNENNVTNAVLISRKK